MHAVRYHFLMDPLLSRRELLGAIGAAALVAPGLASGQTYPPDRIPVTSTGIWPWLRAQLVLEPGVSWLDTASFGPTARAVLVRQYRQLEQQSLDFHAYAEVDANNLLLQALVTSGQFFGANPGDLVLTGSARAGTGIARRGSRPAARATKCSRRTHDHPAAAGCRGSRRRGGAACVSCIAAARSAGVPRRNHRADSARRSRRARKCCWFRTCNTPTAPCCRYASSARSRAAAEFLRSSTARRPPDSSNR